MPLTFVQDIKNKELAPLKLLLFLQSAGDMALYPFFTLHMKYLNLSVTDIGIQFAVAPISTLIATPLVGLLADKIGNFRVMLSLSLFICAALSQCLVFVPPVGYLATDIPPHMRTRVSCDSNSSTGLAIERLARGNASSLGDDSYYVSSCNWTCSAPDMPSFLPFLCFRSTEGALPVPDQCVASWLLGDKARFRVNNTSGGFAFRQSNFDQIRCKRDPDVNSAAYLDGSCHAVCAFHRDESQAPPRVVDQASRSLTFWTYMAVRILLIVTIATEMSLFKAAILTVVDKCDSEYGFQRVWATGAACVVPLITGTIMDQLQDGDVEDYRPCFYIYGGMKVVMAIIIFFIPLTAKPPTLEIWKNVLRLVKNPEVCVLLCYCTFVGSCWGFLETFLFWFMENLGASKLLMGLTFTIGSLCGIPTSIFSGAIERRMGHVAIISLGIVAYAVRFVGYSFVKQAWQALFFESLECLTMSLMLITLTTYANRLASAELVATMQATWAALHFAVGRALGSVVGGFMIDGVGAEMTYRLYAVKCLVMGLLYLALQYCWLRHRHVDNNADNKAEPIGQEFVLSEKPAKIEAVGCVNSTFDQNEAKELSNKLEKIKL